MGAGGDAGRAIALAFADAGASLALTTATAAADEAFTVQRLARSIAAKGRRSLAEAVDMSLGANVQVAMRQLSRALGPPDVLVVVCEAPLDKPAERVSDAEWAAALNQNLSAVFYACRGAAREMLAREPAPSGERGRIIVVASRASGGAAYAAAKAGVAALVPALAAEWRDRGIAVNLLAAGAASVDAAAARALWLASAAATGISGEEVSVGA